MTARNHTGTEGVPYPRFSWPDLASLRWDRAMPEGQPHVRELRDTLLADLTAYKRLGDFRLLHDDRDRERWLMGHPDPHDFSLWLASADGAVARALSGDNLGAIVGKYLPHSCG